MSRQKTILTIRNCHIPECGTPPTLGVKNGTYTAYFENQHGEQAVMQYDPTTKTARLLMGDVGWEEELKVVAFRGEPLVLFARSKQTRHEDSKLNKQFDGQQEMIENSTLTAAERESFKQRFNNALRQAFGKPRLSDAEWRAFLGWKEPGDDASSVPSGRCGTGSDQQYETCRPPNTTENGMKDIEKKLAQIKPAGWFIEGGKLRMNHSDGEFVLVQQVGKVFVATLFRPDGTGQVAHDLPTWKQMLDYINEGE